MRFLILFLTLVSLSVFAGVSEMPLQTQAEPERYTFDPHTIPPVMPFEMRWPDVDYYLACKPLNPSGVYMCKFLYDNQ